VKFGGIEISSRPLKETKNREMVSYSYCQNQTHQGKSIHLWEIRITDENDNLISIYKLTNMILQKKTRKRNNA
jgi:hypothetical protein